MTVPGTGSHAHWPSYISSTTVDRH